MALNFNQLTLHRLRRILAKVNAHAKEIHALSDQALQAKTKEFKERLKNGESLDKLLPEAYAVVREADDRVLGMRPYDVQVLGAIALHKGFIAEMKTGEGKTLTATMPLYLNALTGKGAMLVTTNNYLAYRDANDLAPVYRWLGVSVATTAYDQSKGGAPDRKPAEKREIYNSDIIYTTNSALGFDYLLDNLASSMSKKYMRDFNFAIVDEADEVLLDVAQTPLVISGVPRVQSNLYGVCDEFVTMLTEDVDYIYDEEENKVWLTKKGWAFANRFFRRQDLFSGDHDELLRHIHLALLAHKTMERDREYVVAGGEVSLLDDVNGRILTGMRLQAGQHQALEQKEGVELTKNMRTMATITYQNLFALFNRLSGMTGTAKLVENELMSAYHLRVVQIPTNRPVQRKDLPSKLYTTLAEKLGASLAEVKRLHKKGQPILIVTGSVEVSELYADILLQNGIAHNVLNAHNTVKEAAIIADAGQKNAVTVATTMAGRGTDIKLGPGVAELGGLAIIGVELLSNRRVDAQVRGRAGRQGDPGFSQFYFSLEDRLIIQRGMDALHKYYKKHEDDGSFNHPKELKSFRLKRWVKLAQLYNESQQQIAREQTVEYDESIRLQRERLYAQRNRLLKATDKLSPEPLLDQAFDDYLASVDELDEPTLNRYIWDNISYNFEGVKHPGKISKAKAKAILTKLAKDELADKKVRLQSKDQYQNFLRTALLKAVDTAWVQEVDYLQQLKTVVMARSLAQLQPTFEYHQEAFAAYGRMQKAIYRRLVVYLLLSQVEYDKGEIKVYFA